MTSKYHFQRPQNTREQIEAIALEMRAGGGDQGTSMKTIKDLLVELVMCARTAEHRHDFHERFSKRQEALALLTFASLCLLLTFLGSNSDHSDIELLQNNRFFLRTLGIGLATLFVGVVIERAEMFELVWRHNITKLLASIALSALVVYSAGRASSIINNVFGVDAGAMPYARALLTGWIAFGQVAKPVMWLLVLPFTVIHGLVFIGWCKEAFWPSDRDEMRPDFPWLSAWFVVLAVIVLGNAYTWLYQSLEETQLPTKVYQMARTLDFNSRHTCANLPVGINVVYIGPDQRKVLVDPSDDPVLTFAEFVGRPAAQWEQAAQTFPTVECAPQVLK